MAAKDNTSESEIDKTSFWWAGLCAICHPGGGPTEFDRDGELYYDVNTGQFGYEKLGLTAGDVTLDGDYSEINHMTGAHRAAPWDLTGVAEPDCLLCHRVGHTINGGTNMNWVWRAATLRAKDNLVDDNTDPVMAFAAAATASQGWFSNFATAPNVKPPLATLLQIDYQAGVDNGSLVEDASGNLKVAQAAVQGTPVDYVCWGCHVTPDLKKRGRTWFDASKDVHYAGFSNLDDADAGNDIAPENSAACTRCHPGDAGHNIAKGNATLGSVRNDTDYVDFRTCRDCHDPASPLKDPEAPEPSTAITAHTVPGHAVMSCEFCHIPYKHDAADLVVDNAVTGVTAGYPTSAFLSEDPLNPAAADGDTRWYPAFEMKNDQGTMRLFPTKLLLSAWWGDWQDVGSSGVLDAGDVIKPIALWRVRQITAGAPLGVVIDDNGDARPEVNSEAEILAYIAALQAVDNYGNPVAVNPVLVKGGKVWWNNGGSLASQDYHGTGVLTESSHPFSINHNVLPTTEALGAGGLAGCTDCHGGANTPVFDRLILVDPWGTDGLPVYDTVRNLTGVSPN